MKNHLLRITVLGLSLYFFRNNAAAQPAAEAKWDSTALKKRITGFFNYQASVKEIYSVSLSPDAEQICWNADNGSGARIWIADLKSVAAARRLLPDSLAGQSDPQWSPDGKKIAFFFDPEGKGQLQLKIAEAKNGKLLPLHLPVKWNGFVSRLRWSPDGSFLSLLYVKNAHRDPSPMAAENRATGLIDSNQNQDVQQLIVVNSVSGKVQSVSPPGLYVFEYDWLPAHSGFVYTAAAPPGDDNWYIARLYRQSLSGDSIRIFTPRLQIAVPRCSPDGKSVCFIEGLMSDEGGTGGEVWMMPADGSAAPRNLTSGRKSTPSWIHWINDSSLLFSEFAGGSSQISTLSVTGRTKTLWQSDVTFNAGAETMSLSVAGDKMAFIQSGWNELPAVYVGLPGHFKKVTRFNDPLPPPTVRARNITWSNEGQPVQGWLLYPEPYDAANRYPMLVAVHGGPAWISTPGWSTGDFNTTVYPQLGYFVFFPNPRGSYGQGEAFTQANKSDWGFGDLDDIIKGIDTLYKQLPIDSNRVGILGWSYGGSMAMMAAARTSKFRAAVAGAGAGDWLSYYGQNRIDKWMNSYFEVSPYQNPTPYQRVSAMTYIKTSNTPTLLLVGERDGESPSPQSFQYWHALKELGVPTQLMVYPDEGHAFQNFDNMIDVSFRSIQWLNRYLQPFGDTVQPR